MKRFRVPLPTPGLVVAVLALFVALSGVAVGLPGKNKVDKGDIKKNAVTAKKIKRNAVTMAKLRNGAVTTTKLAGDAVTTDKIAAGAVGAGKIGPGSVGTSELGDGQVTPADLQRPPRMFEYSQPGGTADVPFLSVGDLLLRADCSTSGGAATTAIEAATSSGAGTIESSGIAETEAGAETTFVNGPLSISPSFTGIAVLADANVGALGSDGNYKLLYDGPGVFVSVDMTVSAIHTATTDTCAVSGIAVSAD